MAQSWWVQGLYSSEVETPTDVGQPELVAAYLAVLSDAHGSDALTVVSQALGVHPGHLGAILANPVTARRPLSPDRPDWARDLPRVTDSVLSAPGYTSWAKQSATAHLVAPLLQEVMSELAPCLSRLKTVSGLVDLEANMFDKLVYVLDQNIAAAPIGDVGSDPVAFWQSRPAALRHARAVSGAFARSVQRFDRACAAPPRFIHPDRMTNLFIEPLDLHHGGTSVVIAAGTGVLQPRPSHAFALFSGLLCRAQDMGFLASWRLPAFEACAEGTWVEWVGGTNLEDMPADRLVSMAPDLAVLAVLLWTFGAASIEAECIIVAEDSVSIVQINGIFAPVLGQIDEIESLRQWIDLFFAGDGMAKLDFDEQCRAKACAALDAAATIARDLTALASTPGTVRSFARPMTSYSQLLRTVPRLAAAGDSIARELVFARLHQVSAALAPLSTGELVRAEIADLRQYELAFLTAGPDGLSVFLDSQTPIGDLLHHSAIDQINARIGPLRNMARGFIDTYM